MFIDGATLIKIILKYFNLRTGATHTAAQTLALERVKMILLIIFENLYSSLFRRHLERNASLEGARRKTNRF